MGPSARPRRAPVSREGTHSPPPGGALYLGVTGHRNITSSDGQVSELVAKECRRLRRRWPDARVSILSGLAEGADRLVVDVAREVLQASVVAVLPLPAAMYLRDFATTESRSEYEALVAGARRVIQAPFLASSRACARSGEPRNHQYAWAGAFIAKRSHILFALWDGEPARGTGGTAHVVSWFVDGAVPRPYRISFAPRLATAPEHARELIHLNPRSHRVRRTTIKAPVHG